MGRDILLSIRGLRIEGRSGDAWHPIVKGVDLTLHRGEVLGLIGESGAGKSTLGLAAMGFARDGCRISGGTIDFDGIDLRTAPEATRRSLRGKRIAYVAQSAAASFNPAHRLIGQYCEGPVVHGVMSREKAEGDAVDLYRRMRLPNPEDIGFRYPHQVSGGQLQRAMTAMAMSCRPDLIIFDEPTTALDVTTQIEVLAAIRDIVRQFGTAAIYITHDLAGSFARPEQPPGRGTPVVSVRNVTAGYGAVDVLRNVSFDIHARRTVAVVGESGSGKSTTARVITGLLPPRKGQVLMGGKTLPPGFKGRSRDELRQCQMIYQMADTALNPRLRLRELIGRPAEMYLGLTGKALEARIRDLLALIELEPDTYIDRLPSELSGGQKQRIGIARALAAEPQLIICDEVTSALDQIVQEGILKLLDRLQGELNLACMFITHDLATVKSIADEVVVMQQGVVVEHGPKAALFADPKQDYTRLLLSSVPEMDPDWLNRLLAERGEDA